MTSTPAGRIGADILGMHVDITSYHQATEKTCSWAQDGDSRFISIATVNNVMEAYDSPKFAFIVNQADLVTPDGMPLVWALKLLGHNNVTRVYGPDLTPLVLAAAAAESISVGFYGGSTTALERLLEVVKQRYPALRIAFAYSPPFRPLTEREDDAIIQAINDSGARILFIGLNTPKQECWMAEHKGRVRSVMLGVGAAFDFLAGTKPQAPRWMMLIGMEWSFRLLTEPRRLWKRYLKHNPRFVILFAFQLLGWKGPDLRFRA